MVEETTDIVSLFEGAIAELRQYNNLLGQRDWANPFLGAEARQFEDALINQLDQLAILEVAAQFFVAASEGAISKAMELQKLLCKAKEVGVGVAQK
jgi:hypothetical protein